MKPGSRRNARVLDVRTSASWFRETAPDIHSGGEVKPHSPSTPRSTTPAPRAAATIALVEAVDHPNLRLNLDLYHAQIGEGSLIRLVERALPLIGEIQVADVSGRQEPGTGEIHYPAIAATLRRLGYDGVVAMEAWASGSSEDALDRFREAFTS